VKAYIVQYGSGYDGEGVPTSWSDDDPVFEFDPKLARYEQAARAAAKAYLTYLQFVESLAAEPLMLWRIVLRSTEDHEVLV
jgi:hypothetical protein